MWKASSDLQSKLIFHKILSLFICIQNVQIVSNWHKDLLICCRFLVFTGTGHFLSVHGATCYGGTQSYMWSDWALTWWAGDTDWTGPGGNLDKSSDTEWTDMDTGTCDQHIRVRQATFTSSLYITMKSLHLYLSNCVWMNIKPEAVGVHQPWMDGMLLRMGR